MIQDDVRNDFHSTGKEEIYDYLPTYVKNEHLHCLHRSSPLDSVL